MIESFYKVVSKWTHGCIRSSPCRWNKEDGHAAHYRWSRVRGWWKYWNQPGPYWRRESNFAQFWHCHSDYSGKWQCGRNYKLPYSLKICYWLWRCVLCVDHAQILMPVSIFVLSVDNDSQWLCFTVQRTPARSEYPHTWHVLWTLASIHRITECLRLEGASGGHLVLSPSSRAT